MATIEAENKLANAMSQARAQYDSIAQMVGDLERAEEQDRDGGANETEAPRQRIEEDALSVQVRSCWYDPCAGESARKSASAGEYEILLCTGGPAVRIVGTLNEYCEPDTARLQCQDWFTPWTDWTEQAAGRVECTETLLAYARCFYFGEG